MNIRLSKDVSFPDARDAVTQTIAILGKRGSGKTTTATVLVEELLSAGQHVVVIDPLDVWWGLRANHDGKQAGFEVSVIGGDHADLPLEATSGAVLAEFVVEHKAPLILSVRHLSIGDQRRFATDFFERLYNLKGRQANRTALHLVIDEADEFAPQRIQHGHERLFGAIDRIVRRGRASGLGVTLISQRAAVLNKDVLSQCEVMICHQTISPQDRKALEAWIQAHDAHDQRATFMESLAVLKRGEAWVWSPGWLDIFKRTQIRNRATFDSSSTPKGGRTQDVVLQRVDLPALQARMAETVERAKADDPRELRKRISELEKQLRQRAPVDDGRLTELQVLAGKQRDDIVRLQGMVAAAQGAARDATQHIREAAASVERWQAHLDSLTPDPRAREDSPTRPSRTPRFPVEGGPDEARAYVPTKAPEGDGELGSGAPWRMLAVIKQYPGVDARRLGALAGVSPRLSTYRVGIAKLKLAGYVEGDRSGGYRLTPTGAKAAKDVPLPPTGKQALEHWRRELGDGAPRMIFDALVGSWPHAISAQRIHELTGIDPSISTYRVAVAKLRNLELVDGDRRGMKASDALFD